MPAYIFQAVDTGGQPQRGLLEAVSATAARGMLRDRNLLPISVEPAAGAIHPAAATQSLLARLRRPRLGSKVLALLTRQLSTLIASDIRIEEALRIVAQQSQGPAGPLLLEVRGAVVNGRSLAAALADHPTAFPDFYRSSVTAGEQSGKLPEVLEHLTHFLETRDRARQKVQLALIYPAILAAVAGGMIVLLLVFVVPDIVKVFVSRGATLPFLTRALIALSAGVQKFGLLALLTLLLLGWGVSRWMTPEVNRLRVARFLAQTPPFARFSQQINAARFAASLATLVQSHVPLVDALNAAAAVTPNRHIRERARGVAAQVREGVSLQRAMTTAACFPPMLLAMAASGEASGKLGPTLGRAATDLERDTETLLATLVALVEPAVLLVMGGVVLLLVLSILLPIVNLNNLAGQ